MSETAIFETTLALRRRLEAAIGGSVYVGAPIRGDMGDSGLALFLIHIEPNRDLRNSGRFNQAFAAGPSSVPNPDIDTIPLDLRYLVAAFRSAVPGGGGDPDELIRIGQVIRHLHANPVLSGAALEGQTVRVSPEPCSMDELARIWDAFPDQSYQTSMVYLATPVFVDAGPLAVGPPVLHSRLETGISTAPPAMAEASR